MTLAAAKPIVAAEDTKQPSASISVVPAPAAKSTVSHGRYRYSYGSLDY